LSVGLDHKERVRAHIDAADLRGDEIRWIRPARAEHIIAELLQQARHRFDTGRFGSDVVLAVEDLPSLALETSNSEAMWELSHIGRLGSYVDMHLVCGAKSQRHCAVLPLSLRQVFTIAPAERF